MAMFRQVRNKKSYAVRKQICLNRSKQLLRFDSESVDFLANEILGDKNETRGGALSSRQQMEIFLRFVGTVRKKIIYIYNINVCVCVFYIEIHY